MNKQVIITNGTGGCGKDTFAKFVSQYCNTYKYSSIDKVKDVAKQCGWQGSKLEKGRKFLSDLKLLTTEYNDMPFIDLKEIVRDFNANLIPARLLLIDIREPNEIERAKKEFNAITVLIKNDNVKHITSNMADANVFDYDYDYVIDNSGSLEELEEKAKWFVNEVVEKRKSICDNIVACEIDLGQLEYSDRKGFQVGIQKEDLI